MKPFIYKEIDGKINYGVFHPDVENGKKLLGWINKTVADYENNKTTHQENIK